MRPNNVCCIGGNQMGGLISCVIALKCPEVRVVVVDNEKTISEWNSNNPPFNEPELDKFLKKCRNRNLFFSSDYATSIADADLIFLPTDVPIRSKPPGKMKKLDFTELEEAAKLIAAHAESDKIVVGKSPTCARAAERVSAVLDANSKPGVQYYVLSNPHYITEGFTLSDVLNPAYVLIGCRKNSNHKSAAQSLSDLYEYWIPRDRIKILRNSSVEIATLAVSALLAQKATSMSGVVTMCEESGANPTEVVNTLNKDSRLMTELPRSFLSFGSFQKALSGLIVMYETFNMTEAAGYWQCVLDMHSHQTKRFLQKIHSIVDPVEGMDIAILGFALAKNTSETKNSPAIEICQLFLSKKCNLRIYDPVIPAAQIIKDLEVEFMEERQKRIFIFDDVYKASFNTSAIIICTDWDEFETLDFPKIVKWLNKPIVIDGHNLFKENTLKNMGLDYYAVNYGI